MMPVIFSLSDWNCDNVLVRTEPCELNLGRNFKKWGFTQNGGGGIAFEIGGGLNPSVNYGCSSCYFCYWCASCNRKLFYKNFVIIETWKKTNIFCHLRFCMYDNLIMHDFMFLNNIVNVCSFRNVNRPFVITRKVILNYICTWEAY